MRSIIRPTIRLVLKGARRLTLVALPVLALSACSTIALTSTYDEPTDTGATQILADTTAFVNKMIPLAGTPAGAYQANQDFYTTEEGKISALETRAEARKVLGICPSTAVVAKAVSAIGSMKQVTADPAIAAKFQQYAGSIKDDDCEIVVLEQLYAEMEDLKGFHNAQGPKGIPAAASGPILVGGIGLTVQVINTIEAAKKAGQTGAK